MNVLMAWLLKYDGYPPGVVLAVLLHGFLLWVLLPSEFQPVEQVQIRPQSIAARMAPDNPQRLRRLEQLDQQRAADAARQRELDAARQREAEAARAQQQREREAAQQAEAERQRRLEAERQQQAEAEVQRQREQEQAVARQREEEQRQAAEREAAEARQREQELAQQRAAEEAANQAARTAAENAENDLVSQYAGIIHDLISRYWNVPPSARNGMSADIDLQLVPTGEVVNSRIVRSSGDPAFDRAALQAVERVGSFPELRDLPLPVFERNFRHFTLEFKPEDLLR